MDNDNELSNELENLFDHINDQSCSGFFKIPSNFTISGISVGNIYVIFSYLIPNLFRLCYSQEKISVPSVCPSFITEKYITNHLPIILDIETVKSFLYFNFPSSINFNKNQTNDFLKQKFRQNMIIDIKKRNITYGSYSLPNDFLIYIYNDYSLLIQLKNFYNYLISSLTDKTINSFKLIWDFTQLCKYYFPNNSYIVGNDSTNNIFNQLLANNIYTIYNDINNIYGTKGLLSPIIVFLINNNIFTILNAANQVFEDVLNEIDYYISGKKYCKKKYMNRNNIPELLKIYNNYYKNQVYTNSKGLVNGNITNVITNQITIQEYVKDFIKIYKDTYINRYFIKTIYFNKNNALVFFGNFADWSGSGIAEYWYFYININNPSAIELFNINTNIAVQYTSVSSYTTNFNASYIISNPTYIISKSMNYNKDGLYPDGGTDYTSSENIGILYYFSNNIGIIKSIIYETLQSFSSTTTYGIGVSLNYFGE
jgi:hypothetical protein